jgi:hypothetical protein
MIRIVLTAWFALLLVGMQQQLVVHEVDHLRAKVQRGHDAGLETTGDGACVECALLAAGSNAAPVADASADFAFNPPPRLAFRFDSLLAVAPPAFYFSTGPPALL